jgi:hypothetical protein
MKLFARAGTATLLPQAKHLWYLGANVPGKPRVFMPYAGGMARHREICTAARFRGTRLMTRGRDGDLSVLPAGGWAIR